MKPLCTILVAAAVAAACSKSEPPQAADTPQPLIESQAAVPADAPPAPTAVAPTTGQQSPARPPAERSARDAAVVTDSSASSVAAAAPAIAPQAVPPAAAPVGPLAAAPPPAPPKVPAPPPPPPAPRFRDVTIPAGTAISVTVLSNLASNRNQVEDIVKGALARSVVVDGVTALPANAQITGIVSDVKQSGRVKGKASIAVVFNRVSAWDSSHQIQTARVILEADSSKKDDVKKGGLGAGLGAVVGGIAGGGTGAAIGAVTGGTAAVVGTKGKEVEVPAGTVVQALLQDPVTVRVPVR